MKEDSFRRCDWASFSKNPLMIEYHDKEWGVPAHDDKTLFEFLVLEGAQAGLSWETVLNKRENYRRAFHGFELARIARYDKNDVQRLLGDSGIIRNRLKIQATIENAKQSLVVIKEFGSFDNYIWRFVGGRPIRHKFNSLGQIPATTNESDSMSKELRALGFRFVGPTICYAFMQAVGMVNDHITKCFRYDTV
ncbi:MAG TPA: DNA-3-methyladenine glycosylase I [Candidatus Angelobacter sp.]|nr:DNA-3-methyladenine glycosylase I [Candidatus Angelobacter sp.]